MKEFVSHSQAGQDKFIHDLLGDSGTFLDIGACLPFEDWFVAPELVEKAKGIL